MPPALASSSQEISRPRLARINRKRFPAALLARPGASDSARNRGHNVGPQMIPAAIFGRSRPIAAILIWPRLEGRVSLRSGDQRNAAAVLLENTSQFEPVERFPSHSVGRVAAAMA